MILDDKLLNYFVEMWTNLLKSKTPFYLEDATEEFQNLANRTFNRKLYFLNTIDFEKLKDFKDALRNQIKVMAVNKKEIEIEFGLLERGFLLQSVLIKIFPNFIFQQDNFFGFNILSKLTENEVIFKIGKEDLS